MVFLSWYVFEFIYKVQDLIPWVITVEAGNHDTGMRQSLAGEMPEIKEAYFLKQYFTLLWVSSVSSLT